MRTQDHNFLDLRRSLYIDGKYYPVSLKNDAVQTHASVLVPARSKNGKAPLRCIRKCGKICFFAGFLNEPVNISLAMATVCKVYLFLQIVVPGVEGTTSQVTELEAYCFVYFIKIFVPSLKREMILVYGRSFTLLVSAVILIRLTAESTHQIWWYGCRCSHWQPRYSMRDAVMQTYKGLFVGNRELHRLPVVKLHRHGGTSTRSYVSNTIPNSSRNQNLGCCFTEYSYEVFNFTVVNRQRFTVVHFDNAFQFVPTGRCRANSTCVMGSCMQMYRHHWLLVWDDRLPSWPPVTFLPVEVPSHCDCVNVGT
ncbi:hypothetical protein ScPMuIL_017403 [Solemya velum]